MTPTQGEHAQTELAHELFAAAQLAPGEGIEDAVSRIAAALTATPAQPEAPQGVAYAELPEPDATTVGLGAVWNRHSMRDFADRTHYLRASHGKAPAGAAGRFIDQSAELKAAHEGYEKRITRVSERNHHDQSMYTLGWWDCAWNAAPTPQPAPATQQAGEPARSNCMDCANTDSWGLPDKVFCRTCVSGSHWEPLNRDSVNPNKAAPQPTPTAQAAESVPAVAKGAPIAAYPPLPDLGDGSKLWGAIGRHHRAITAVDIDKAAKAVDEAAIAMLLSYVDADRAARKQGGA